MNKWIVNVKGKPNASFEISVLREDNHHGISSYGWFGEDKLYVSSCGGPCDNTVSPYVWDKLIQVAEEYAEQLNQLEPLDP